MRSTFDLIIAGGGILGLASAYRILQRFHGMKLLLLEKEGELARHQTGRNSGVIHSGIYYKPGSQKARLCRLGYSELLNFVRAEQIKHEICGKVIVATKESDLDRLIALEHRALENGIANVTRLDPQSLKELEPEALGVAALHIPETGIVDYREICARLADHILKMGGKIQTHENISGISGSQRNKTVQTRTHSFSCGFFLNCGGLNSDKLARMDGLEPRISIIPFRGEYYSFKQGAPSLIRNLIYPVPDPAFPFLGVHFTRIVHGGIECGPNAVLALGREAYSKTDFSLRDAWEMFRYSGFHALARKHWRMGMAEIHRSISKSAFVAALQKLVPAVHAVMLEPRAAGIRAQAVCPDGTLVEDFEFAAGDGSLHVLNAPSPAATASLAIGEEIAERVARLFR